MIEGRQGLPVTKPHTSISFFFFTSSLWDKEIINFVSNFLQNIFAKVSFPLLKSWPWHHSMFLEFSFFSTTSGNLLCFSKTSKINANNILSRRNWNLRKNTLLLALSYELQIYLTMTRSGTWFPLRYHVPLYHGATMQCKFHAISIYHSGFNKSREASFTN